MLCRIAPAQPDEPCNHNENTGKHQLAREDMLRWAGGSGIERAEAVRGMRYWLQHRELPGKALLNPANQTIFRIAAGCECKTMLLFELLAFGLDHVKGGRYGTALGLGL